MGNAWALDEVVSGLAAVHQQLDLTGVFLLASVIVFGGVPKWLRGRSAKPLSTGSIPVAASDEIYGHALCACPFFYRLC